MLREGSSVYPESSPFTLDNILEKGGTGIKGNPTFERRNNFAARCKYGRIFRSLW